MRSPGAAGSNRSTFRAHGGSWRGFDVAKRVRAGGKRGDMWLLGGGKGRRVARNGVEGRSRTQFRERRGRSGQWQDLWGRYEHSLDIKGRVILPAKFRAQFERGGYLAQQSEGCLALVDPGGVRSSDGGHAGAGRVGSGQPQPGPAVGIELPRGGDRSPGAHGDPGPSPCIRRAGERGAGARGDRSGGAVEPDRPGRNVSCPRRAGCSTTTTRQTERSDRSEPR